MALDPTKTTRVLYHSRRLLANVQDVGLVQLTHESEQALTDNVTVGNQPASIHIHIAGQDSMVLLLRDWPALKAEVDKLVEEAGVHLPDYQAQDNLPPGGGV